MVARKPLDLCDSRYLSLLSKSDATIADIVLFAICIFDYPYRRRSLHLLVSADRRGYGLAGIES